LGQFAFLSFLDVLAINQDTLLAAPECLDECCAISHTPLPIFLGGLLVRERPASLFFTSGYLINSENVV
jgi:hypothetical protein